MRIQVNVSEEMLKKIDACSELVGVTRSSFCSMVLSQAVLQFLSEGKEKDTTIKK